MPLLSAYDQKLAEKEDKLKLMKIKIDDFTGKFRDLIEENTKLRVQAENMPNDLKIEM